MQTSCWQTIPFSSGSAQLGLQLQVGNDISAVKDSVRAVGDDFSSVKNGVQAVEEGMHLFKASVVFWRSERTRGSRIWKLQMPDGYG